MPSTLKEGLKAPTFSLPTDSGVNVSLKDYSGKMLVLYFYPKDDTAGCTAEALDFTSKLKSFEKAGAAILGVSKDPPAKHARFKTKHGLKIALGSDEDGEMLAAYGVWVEKSMYGRTYWGIERATFIIDAQGVIRRIWRKVRVKGHVEEALDAVKQLG